MRNDKSSSHARFRAATFVALTVTVAASVAACSSSSKPKASSTNVAATAGGGKAGGSSVDLSGKWKGDYGGDFKGTFTLTWTQSGNKLTGSITLSAPASTLDINGTITGNSIKFGTVGSAAISYTGSEQQGSVMEGSYSVAGAGGGNWGASKSS